MKAEVTGINEANAALTKALGKVSGPLSERFVTKAVISVEANSLQYVPIDTSFLANSAYRKVTQKGEGFEGEMGYGAEYAAAVHEAPGTLKGTNTPRGAKGSGRGNVWDPTGEPGFLAKGVEDFIAEDLDKLLQQEFGS